MTTPKTFRRFFFLCCLICISISCNKDSRSDQYSEASYNELHRPQLHFSPEAHWMNDPNGLVYLDGEYHLFYQYFPDSTVWGPMHWGHALSTDLVQWKHLPVALYPDSLGYIFSGSAVIDWNNTSGLGSPGNPAMVAIFTHNDPHKEKAGRNDFQNQSIAYSLDKGRSWHKYSENPVLTNPGIRDFRDPKVIWHADSQKWIMVLAAYDRVHFYSSSDLKKWKFESEFGIPGDRRLWECPDLFPMKPVDTDETKWVLISSIQQEAPNGGTATGYFVGEFDGKNFICDPTDQKWLDYGTDNYAMVSWSDIPDSDGRRLALGWMSNWQYAQQVPTEKWRSAMTLPRSLELVQHEEDYLIRSMPVEELNQLHTREIILNNWNSDVDEIIFPKNEKAMYRIDIQFIKPEAGRVIARLENEAGEVLEYGLDCSENKYFIDRRQAGDSSFSNIFAALHEAPRFAPSDTVNMNIWLDLSSIELFADKGLTVITDIYFPTEPFTKMRLKSDSGEIEVLSLELKHLKSIWK